MTAPGPYTVYGLNLPTDEYRLVSADHPSHLPETTITYAPWSGVAEGEGYITVSVTTAYRTPALLNVPPGAPADTWSAAAYLPQPGVAVDNGVTTGAEWIGPGGLYTISINSAHSSLTLEQAAALLVPVDLSELQASLMLTATVTPQPPATGNGTAGTHSSASDGMVLLLLGAGAMLLAAIAGSVCIRRQPSRERQSLQR